MFTGKKKNEDNKKIMPNAEKDVFWFMVFNFVLKVKYINVKRFVFYIILSLFD